MMSIAKPPLNMEEAKAQIAYEQYKLRRRSGLGKYDHISPRWGRLAEVADRFGEWERVMEQAEAAQGNPSENGLLDALEKLYEKRTVEAVAAEKESAREAFIEKAHETLAPTDAEMTMPGFELPLEAVRDLFNITHGGRWFETRGMEPAHLAMFKRLHGSMQFESIFVADTKRLCMIDMYRLKGT
jgi:hypothetical protein